MSELKPHPLAGIFPALDEGQLQELAADIRKNGLRQTIVTHQGQVLDGRNRLAACKIAGVEPRYEEYEGDDPLGYVISLNLTRRHLSETQRAMVAAKIANMRQGERTDLEPSANLRKVSQRQAAKMLKVSARSVTNARKVIEKGGPALVAAVRKGDVSVSAAAKVVSPPNPIDERPEAQVPKISKEQATELKAHKAALLM